MSPETAPDGSPVAFYRRLPPTGEPETIAAIVPPGSTILELGCGAGRVAGPLAAMGYVVSGVDNGPGMIAALPPAVHGVVGDAAGVRLGRRFDVVLLLSHLVNDPDHGTAFLGTAAAHVAPGGVVIVETYPPGADPTDGIGRTSHIGPAHVTLLRARRRADLLRAAVRYGVDGRTWTQIFTARILDEAKLRTMLEDAGLSFAGWLERPGWLLARPG